MYHKHVKWIVHTENNISVIIYPFSCSSYDIVSSIETKGDDSLSLHPLSFHLVSQWKWMVTEIIMPNISIYVPQIKKKIHNSFEQHDSM